MLGCVRLVDVVNEIVQAVNAFLVLMQRLQECQPVFGQQFEPMVRSLHPASFRFWMMASSVEYARIGSLPVRIPRASGCFLRSL